MENNRFISTSKTLTDVEIENSLRPTSMAEYVGQTKVKGNLEVYIKAAKKRKDFETADKIRDDLKAVGITLEDRPGETTWSRS